MGWTKKGSVFKKNQLGERRKKDDRKKKGGAVLQIAPCTQYKCPADV
jgi:hypothetical protein